MSDEIDQANEIAELNLEVALRNSRKEYTKLAPRGFCHNELCELEFEHDSKQLFCDKACAKAYDKLRKMT